MHRHGLVALGLLTACGSRATTMPPPTTTVENTAVIDPADACAALQPTPANPVLGELPRRAVPLSGPTVDGGTLDLASLRGKVVLVSVQATFDALTPQELPTFARLTQTLGDRVAVVRIVSGESPSEVVQQASAAPNAVPLSRTLFDNASDRCSPIGPLSRSWGITVVPESYLVDRAGNVRFYFVNKRDWGSTEALSCVKALLADNRPAMTQDPAGATDAPPCAPAEGTEKSGGRSISGTITFAASLAPKRGMAVFVVARTAATKVPIAVTRVIYDGKPIPFTLDEQDAMIVGDLAGTLTLSARYDQDNDAMTKQPGDLTGTATATVPATGVTLVIDTRLN